jgi:hypothetical protein
MGLELTGHGQQKAKAPRLRRSGGNAFNDFFFCKQLLRWWKGLLFCYKKVWAKQSVIKFVREPRRCRDGDKSGRANGLHYGSNGKIGNDINKRHVDIKITTEESKLKGQKENGDIKNMMSSGFELTIWAPQWQKRKVLGFRTPITLSI